MKAAVVGVGLRRGWNPKCLGVVKSANGPHETDVWLYLDGRDLDIVVQVNEGGVVKGQTSTSSTRSRARRACAKRCWRCERARPESCGDEEAAAVARLALARG